MDAQISIRSSIPGRVRWSVPGVLNKCDLCAFVDRELAQKPGIQSVSANPVTGGVLVVYEPAQPLSLLALFLQQALDKAFLNPALVRSRTPTAPPLLRLLALTRKHEGQALLA